MKNRMLITAILFSNSLNSPNGRLEKGGDIMEKMFTLRINPLEKARLLCYAEQTLSENMHWGDGEVTIPEEQILHNAIKEAKNNLTLDFFQLELLANWLFDATGEGIVLLGEDISILNNIIGVLTDYYNRLKKEYDKYNVELQKLKPQIIPVMKVLKNLIVIIPETEKKEALCHTLDESLLGEKTKEATAKKKAIEEYKKEMIDQFKKEYYENRRSGSSTRRSIQERRSNKDRRKDIRRMLADVKIENDLRSDKSMRLGIERRCNKQRRVIADRRTLTA